MVYLQKGLPFEKTLIVTLFILLSLWNNGWNKYWPAPCNGSFLGFKSCPLLKRVFPSSWSFEKLLGGNLTTSLGNLFHCLMLLTVRRCFLICGFQLLTLAATLRKKSFCKQRNLLLKKAVNLLCCNLPPRLLLFPAVKRLISFLFGDILVLWNHLIPWFFQCTFFCYCVKSLVFCLL